MVGLAERRGDASVDARERWHERLQIKPRMTRLRAWPMRRVLLEVPLQFPRHERVALSVLWRKGCRRRQYSVQMPLLQIEAVAPRSNDVSSD